eukprot:s1634_g16.t1
MPSKGRLVLPFESPFCKATREAEQEGSQGDGYQPSTNQDQWQSWPSSCDGNWKWRSDDGYEQGADHHQADDYQPSMSWQSSHGCDGCGNYQTYEQQDDDHEEPTVQTADDNWKYMRPKSPQGGNCRSDSPSCADNHNRGYSSWSNTNKWNKQSPSSSYGYDYRKKVNMPRNKKRKTKSKKNQKNNRQPDGHSHSAGSKFDGYQHPQPEDCVESSEDETWGLWNPRGLRSWK